MRSPRLALTLLAALVAVLFAAPVPVLDEESYLDIGRQLDPLRPYDWWRAWQPWGGERTADAYLYAHPPAFLLWVHAWMPSGDTSLPVRALKAAAALPWAMLLGWSAGRLAERMTRRPWLASAAWLAAPITVLGLQRGLMPDLMLAALATFAVVSWVEGLGSAGGLRLRWLLFAGAALGLAACTKYPALVLAPVLVLHAEHTGQRRALGVAGAAFLVVWGGVEAALWAAYGRPHLIEVLATAAEVGRGPLAGRGLGVAARLGLLTTLCWPLLARRWLPGWLPALAAGGVLSLVGAPPGSSTLQLLGLAVLAAAGLRLLAAAAEPLARPARTQRLDRSPGDGLLLGAWALACVAAVVLGHNYAAPRYLLLATLPLTLLVVRRAEDQLGAVALVVAGVVLQGAFALGLTHAERQFAAAQVDAAEAALAAARDAGAVSPGWFSGEWAFRWRMEQAGWTWWDGRELPQGAWVISATEAGPRAIPEAWVEVDRQGRGRAPLRVVDAAASVALYSETVGALPVGCGDGMLETAHLWRVP